MNIIGIVGPIACGKGVVADYLIQTYGYTSFSLSTLVHEEAKRRGVPVLTRTVLQDIGDDLRKREGDGVLARRAIKTLYPKPYTLSPKIIIEGIRNRGEVEYLRTIPGFYLIAVDAPAELRFKRLVERAKPWDPKIWEEFLTIDGRDAGNGTHSNGQQVRDCMKLADRRIQNEGNKEETYKEIEKFFTTKG